jgi:hypothetical protein
VAIRLCIAAETESTLKRTLYISRIVIYFLLVRYSFILGLQIIAFWLHVIKNKSAQKGTKLPSTEGISCYTGFYKLPGLPQRSQISNKQAVTLLYCIVPGTIRLLWLRFLSYLSIFLPPTFSTNVFYQTSELCIASGIDFRISGFLHEGLNG